MSGTIGRLVIGRDLGEAILIGDDIAVIYTQDGCGTSDKGIRLLNVAPKTTKIARTKGTIDPQALVLAAERKQMQAVREVDTAKAAR